MNNNYKLPDFETCFRYSVAARRSFLSIINADYLVDEQKPELIIKESIERSYLCGDDPVRYSIVSNVEEIQSTDENLEDKTMLSISIIPNINTLSKEDQVKLVRKIHDIDRVNESAGQGRVHVIIGVIPWKFEDFRPKENKPRKSGLGGDNSILISNIKLDDWLTHKFWFACSGPNNLQSGSQTEHRASTPDSMSPAMSINSDTSSESESSESSGKIQLLNEVNSPYENVYMQSSIKRYILDVIVHLRMHRLSYHAKGGGAHMGALRDVIQLAKLISFNAGKKFVVPQSVKQASVWYFPMHMKLINDITMDSSTLYGSKPRLVNELLDKLKQIKSIKVEGVENPLFLESLVVQDVLLKVVPPI
ncbi:hypothetical protein NCAS_0A05790 [Naumovozyma castellii]|uniref:Maintenance of telomere capping protein 2 n=1 Tax=Naumovozyma castellii TaxID=27288 RepID=G0V6P1_NAUCA|nr:hypothetical protein NCAS_0A05790 [Naumovozyma castellii CBS 4309]CCC67137.1 hypothetical protein NCAS_0A05790 [Naumovozyma castellii CBS 4309]